MVRGSSSCVTCPVGKYCTPTTFGITCDAGNYCPGANLLKQCPIGTFSTQTGQSSISICVTCTSGYSCESTGLSLPTTQCSVGYICTGGTITPRPSNSGGRMCLPGELCALGSNAVTACPAGSYCRDYASGLATANCEGGYYCPAGSSSSNPIAYLCPTG